MKIAITDACIFIDLYDLQLTSAFFNLEIEIHSTFDVFDELYDEQKELLRAYLSSDKLTIHTITENDWYDIQKMNLPRTLSPNDKTVLYLADKTQCMVLSSDKTIRKQAKKLCCEYHGMLWIFDKLIEEGLITSSIATQKIEKLFSMNITYQNNQELFTEKEKRIEKWRNITE